MDFFKGFLNAITQLPAVIQDTETLFATQGGLATGAQKKAAAIQMVGATISIASAVSTQQIADADKFTAGLSQIVDGVVACLNASVWAKR